MIPASQPREPRSQVVFRYTAQVLRHSGLCERKLASRIAEAYQAQVAPSERIVEFHAGTTIDAATKAERANAQLVSRFRSGTVKLPADLEEAWVSALPDPWRTECQRELTRRYGFLAAKAPDATGTAAAVLGDLVREFGETVEALAPVLADGKIDGTDDLALVTGALKESTDLVAAVVTMQQQLAAALPEGARPADVVQLGAGRRHG